MNEDLSFILTTGNHTFAAMVAEESYSSINTGFKEVTESINSLLENPAITVNDTTFQLEIILGGDYKVRIYTVYMNTFSGTFVLCLVPSTNDGTESSTLNILLCMV